MRKERKVIRKNVVLLMGILIGMTTTSCQSSTNYDSKIIKLGEEALNECEIIPGRTYSVSLENGIYIVDINGTIKQIEIVEKEEEKRDEYRINFFHYQHLFFKCWFFVLLWKIFSKSIYNIVVKIQLSGYIIKFHKNIVSKTF